MFYTSPYKRTRETTEGIAQALEENGIQHKIYQEPRLREQDFGNFQGGPLEMNRVWKERAHYGHLYVSWFFINWTSKGLGFFFFFFLLLLQIVGLVLTIFLQFLPNPEWWVSGRRLRSNFRLQRDFVSSIYKWQVS